MGFLRRLFGKKAKNEVEVKEEIKEMPVEEPVAEPVEEAPIEEPKQDLEEEVEPEAEEPVEEEPKEEPTPEPVPEPKPEPEDEDPDDERPIYEVKLHKDGGWQVIKKGAERAKRRLETQAKAMEYCRENNLKYEVYKMDGTLK